MKNKKIIHRNNAKFKIEKQLSELETYCEENKMSRPTGKGNLDFLDVGLASHAEYSDKKCN